MEANRALVESCSDSMWTRVSAAWMSHVRDLSEKCADPNLKPELRR
jgi:hypothetical protein